MLSGATKMELRTQFANRMFDLVGLDAFHFNPGAWIEYNRDFMAGHLIIVRDIFEGGSCVGFDIETVGKE